MIQRLQRRAGRLLRELVPYNLYYRPVDVHASRQQLGAQPGSGATYQEIVPSHTSRLDLPASMYDLYVDYSKPQVEKEVVAAFVLTLADGRIYADNFDSVAIITAADQLVGDASFQFSKKAFRMVPPEGNNISAQRYFVAPSARQRQLSCCKLR